MKFFATIATMFSVFAAALDVIPPPLDSSDTAFVAQDSVLSPLGSSILLPETNGDREGVPLTKIMAVKEVIANVGLRGAYSAIESQNRVNPEQGVEVAASKKLSTTTVLDHVVLLKVREDATEDEISRWRQAFMACAVIPGVLGITAGATFVAEGMPDRRNGITHTVSVRLESKDAFKVYQEHPLHIKVRDLGIPLAASPLMAVDYESEVAVGDGVSK